MSPRRSIQEVAVGLAFSPSALRTIDIAPGLIDYLELPYELAIRAPAVLKKISDFPVILHSATLSLAGNGSEQALLERAGHIAAMAARLESPWIGEHLAYIEAEEECQCWRTDFTLPPPMNAASVASIVRRTLAARSCSGFPIALENSPLYFTVPESDMEQGAFVTEVLAGTGACLLLDVTHLLITSQNLHLDPFAFAETFPLEKVLEIHLSGMHYERGIHWDSHDQPVPALAADLLRSVLRRARPRAVTLEYNWISDFPVRRIVQEAEKVRKVLNE